MKPQFSGWLLVSALAGCAGRPVISPPQIVTVTKTAYIPIPAALLVPCLVPVGKPVTNSDLLILEQAFTVDLLACNSQLDKIRALKPPRQP